MTKRGIRTNPTAVARAMELYTADLEAAKAMAFKHAPQLPIKLTPKKKLVALRQPVFNLGSSHQLIWYCRQKGYTVPLNKETKKPTVDDDALTLLLEAHPDDPILAARQQYMGARQIISHYLTPMMPEGTTPHAHDCPNNLDGRVAGGGGLFPGQRTAQRLSGDSRSNDGHGRSEHGVGTVRSTGLPLQGATPEAALQGEVPHDDNGRGSGGVDDDVVPVSTQPPSSQDSGSADSMARIADKVTRVCQACKEASEHRIFPEILIHSQASGRWSIVDPPLQQPPHDLYDRMGCKEPWAGLIVPDEGEAWIVWDWSQIEYRLLAVLAQDQPALAAYKENRDLHAENSMLIFGDAEADHRTFTKRFVFRLHYRGEPRESGDIPGARALGLTGAALVPLASRYLAGHPAIRRYWSKQDDQIRARKEQRTFCGRRRRTTSPKLGHKVFKELGNHPLQGGVADILNLTVIRIDEACPWTRLAFTIHDSVILACPVERIDETVPIVHEIVHHEWDVEGHKTVFPAEIKVVHGPKEDT